MENAIEYLVYGKRALFSDPLTRVGGEKMSYPIPTYEALKGITESIYWKPTFVWIIDKVRIINPIKTECQGVRPIRFDGTPDLSIYTYLSNVAYQVRAHFEWNECRPDLISDRDENKHFFSAKRYLESGGRRDIFLGTRECQGYVEPCKFGDGESAYDAAEEYSFDLMYHGIDYCSSLRDIMTVRFWQPIMRNGVIEFIRPEECSVRKDVCKGSNIQKEYIDKGDTK